MAAQPMSRFCRSLSQNKTIVNLTMKRFHIIPRETAVAPTRVEIAGNGVHMAPTGADHFRIMERLVTVPENQSAPVVLPDQVTNQRVVTIRQQLKKLTLDADAVAART